MVHVKKRRQIFLQSTMANTIAAAISYTAPQFTEDDMRREEERMSKEERLEIENDVTGKQAIRRETARTVSDGIVELQRALDAINGTDKQAYLEALSVCPAVVRAESDPIRFLRCEDYNGRAAARRLVKYWEIRRKIFLERAFFPMNLSGAGAMTVEDLEHLGLGAVKILPKDSMGRSVLCHNQSRLNQINLVTALRYTFYFVTVALEDDLSQRHGFVLLGDTSDSRPDRKKTRLLVELVRDCLPIKIRGVHICFPAIKSVGKLFLPTKLWLMGRSLRRRTLMHSGCADELLIDLEEFGMLKEGIPDDFGGAYGARDFEEWVEERRVLEASRV